MARVKLRCIIGCPGLKSSYQEKILLLKHLKGALTFSTSRISYPNTSEKTKSENYGREQYKNVSSD